MVFVSAASLSTNTREHTRFHLRSKGHTAGERILDLVCRDEAGELTGVLKGFTGVGMGGNGSLGYFNANADWNIDIMSSAHTPPSVKGWKVVSACENEDAFTWASDAHQ